MKYLLPWKDISNEVGFSAFARNILGHFSKGYVDCPCVYKNKYGWWCCSEKDFNLIGNEKPFKSSDAIKIYLDKLLIKDGWKFISEDKAEKLVLLL